MSRLPVRVVAAVSVRPWLWSTALRQSFRLAPSGWWHRPPFLPVPDGEYLAMRSTIQYGDPKHSLDTQDVLKYLSWCRGEAR